MVARVERGCTLTTKILPSSCRLRRAGGRALPRSEAGIELRFLDPDCDQGLDVDLGGSARVKIWRPSRCGC
jgi:hypothetical protein